MHHVDLNSLCGMEVFLVFTATVWSFSISLDSTTLCLQVQRARVIQKESNALLYISMGVVRLPVGVVLWGTLIVVCLGVCYIEHCAMCTVCMILYGLVCYWRLAPSWFLLRFPPPPPPPPYSPFHALARLLSSSADFSYSTLVEQFYWHRPRLS